MTVVFEAAHGGRQIHALVIGVDQYPHCGPGTAQRGRLQNLAESITPLSCAAPSAHEVAKWLIDRHRNDGHTPLGSVELLVSSGNSAMTQFNTDDGLKALDRATFDNIRAASNRWYERCNTSANNILWFYFCGHGLRVGQEDILMSEDVGASSENFFENSIKFGASRQALLHCRALVQCYFIDACRDIPEELLSGDIDARRLRFTSSPRPQNRDAPVVYAAPPGESAYGDYDTPTPFATALLQALDGLAAIPGNPGWEITTSDIGLAVQRLIRWNAWPNRPQQWATPAGEPKGGLLRVLPRPPEVPFRLGCAPLDALPKAQLRLMSRDYDRTQPSTGGRWCDKAPAKSYELLAHFAGGEYPDTSDSVIIYPPHREFDLPVGS